MVSAPKPARLRALPLATAALLALAAPARAAPQAGAPLPPAADAPAQPRPRAADAPALPAPRRPAVLLPTVLVEAGVRRAPGAGDRGLAQLAGSLDALLADAAQDLGLAIDLTGRAAAEPTLEERDLVGRARAVGRLLIAPSVAEREGGVEIRIALAEPGARTLRLRIEQASREDAQVRAAVMLRELVADLAGGPAAARPDLGAPHGAAWPGVGGVGGAPAAPVRSVGRGVLAVNATLYGGLVGYSVQRSSGSEDPRLLYPLLAVGAGIGLGGSLIVAEEWDVGVRDAWFLTAGAFWPTIAGHLIYEGRFAARARGDDGERWAFGLVGGATGITLATLGLALRPMHEGGAVLAHSGGGIGLVLGGLGEIAVTGDINLTPFAGMGYGAALGWLAAAAVATQARVSSSRVLALDLGAVLGGLGGAALGSPLLFDAPTPDEQRAWVGATVGGVLVGAGAAWFFTRNDPPTERAGVKGYENPFGWRSVVPRIGVVGESVVGRRRAPALGLSWSGTL